MNPVEIAHEFQRFADTDLGVEDLATAPWATCATAGLQFYSYGQPDEFLAGGVVVPEDGDRVTIMRRPDNPADGNACEVWWRNACHLGHLPRSVAAAVAPRLDARESLRAYVVDKGRGGAWELVLLLVGDAVADLHEQRLDRVHQDTQDYVEHLVAATWPTRGHVLVR